MLEAVQIIAQKFGPYYLIDLDLLLEEQALARPVLDDLILVKKKSNYQS